MIISDRAIEVNRPYSDSLVLVSRFALRARSRILTFSYA